MQFIRPLSPLKAFYPPNAILKCLIPTRHIRYQAFDAEIDPDALKEARQWHKSFKSSQLPSGQTSFARSSGPGGQHVNKTESKAITSWPVKDLIAVLPKLMHPGVRASRYYAARADALTFQAQTSRQRSANSDENFDKLVEEIQSIYRDRVPAESSPDKAKKHAEVHKAFNQGRLKEKKLHSSKKQSRRGPVD